MFSGGKKKIENAQQLFTEAKHYVDLQKEFVKLSLAEKMTVLLSALILGAVVLTLGMIVIFYLSITCVFYLATLLDGNWAAAFGIVTLAMVVICILIYVFRRPLIILPITQFMAHLFLKDEEAGNQNVKEGTNAV